VNAYLKLVGYDVESRVRISFDFRSYNRDGLLFLHIPNVGGRFLVSLGVSSHKFSFLFFYEVAHAPFTYQC